jgi:hypothetical protein
MNLSGQDPNMDSDHTRLFNYTFGKIYVLYVQKIERKGRTKDELNQVLCWLTGHDEQSLGHAISDGSTLETFFVQAPKLNPARSLITGVVCGVRVEDIENETVQNIRCMDKLVDELAKGKALKKIMRG